MLRLSHRSFVTWNAESPSPWGFFSLLVQAPANGMLEVVEFGHMGDVFFSADDEIGLRYLFLGEKM